MTPPPPLPEPEVLHSIGMDSEGYGPFEIKGHTADQLLQYAKDYHAAMLGPRLTDEVIIDAFNDACREKFNGLERFKYFAKAIERRVRGEEA